MPGPFIHISAMRHAANQMAAHGYQVLRSPRIDPNWTGPDMRKLGLIMGQYPNFASLGAIGPDVFFFLPDFRNLKVGCQSINLSSVLITVLDFLEKLYAALDPFITKWEKYLGPIDENLAEEMSRLTGGLSETVGTIAGELKNILIDGLAQFVVGQNDWWKFFSLGLNV